MIPITPENASFLLQYSLPTIKNEHRSTRSVIEAIPQSHLDYRPDPYSKTAMELAWHIAAAEQRFYGGVVAGAFDFAPIHKPETVKTGIDIAKWFDESFERSFAGLGKLTGEQLVKVVDFRGLFQLPAVAYLNFCVHHTIHHRGQLSTYLRAMGGKVPAIYGESHDSAEAKKAAQAPA
jgi:uncharacterized damage-inducible protein DinB